MCYGEVLPSIEKHNMEIEQLGLCQWKMYLLDPIQPRITACLLLEVAKFVQSCSFILDSVIVLEFRLNSNASVLVLNRLAASMNLKV